MSKNNNEKTNVMRLLEKHSIAYNSYSYVNSSAISGVDVAKVLAKDASTIFKTLVTKGKSNNYFVFVIPSDRELDLKKAAKAASEKSIEMIKSSQLLSLTGYIHGGCSPIGMKKYFPTFVDVSALNLDKITYSAGKIGYQVETSVSDLGEIIKISFADLT